jgi:enterochelin esterase family protein
MQSPPVEVQESDVWGAVVASETIARVASEVAGGANPTTAAAEFWESVQTAPLWAKDEEIADAWRVTFLWRGEPEVTRHVTLCGLMVLGATSASGGLRFEHIGGTDIWHLTLRVPAQTRSTYVISPNGVLRRAEDTGDFVGLQATWVRDPLNPSTFIIPTRSDQPEWTPRVLSVLEAPDAVPQRWRIARPGVERGELEQHTFTSAVLRNTRDVWTYTPCGWNPDEHEYPLLLCFDAWEAINLARVPVVLDNLIAAGAIPPVVAVLIGNGTIEMRERELDCDDAFLTFLADELLPWANERWALAPDRSRTLVAGESLGGRAAVFAGLRRPELFGKVIAQATAVSETGALTLAALADQCRASRTAPLELYLDVGLLEIDRTGELAFLAGVRRLTEILRAAGHTVHSAELACGHEDIVYGESLADGLRILLRDDGAYNAIAGHSFRSAQH